MYSGRLGHTVGPVQLVSFNAADLILTAFKIKSLSYTVYASMQSIVNIY